MHIALVIRWPFLHEMCLFLARFHFQRKTIRQSARGEKRSKGEIREQRPKNLEQSPPAHKVHSAPLFCCGQIALGPRNHDRLVGQETRNPTTFFLQPPFQSWARSRMCKKRREKGPCCHAKSPFYVNQRFFFLFGCCFDLKAAAAHCCNHVM